VPVTPFSSLLFFFCFLSFISQTEAKQEVTRAVIDHILVQHFQTFAYKCDLCGNTFNSRGPFHQHMEEAHREQISQFECNLCPAAFYCTKELKGHVKLVHEPSEKGLQLKCEKCDKTFSSRKTKFAHMRGIHNISSKSVKKGKPAGACVCPTCGEKKKSDHNLQQHIRKFHENAFGEPMACPLCSEVKQLRSRKYHTPYSYDLHMKQIHSGGSEGKVVCEYCCKEFIGSIGKVKFALKEHIQVGHQFEITHKFMKPNFQAIHMGIRKACDECGKTFISNIVLNKHKKHVHRKEGAYPCKACGKVFRYSQQAIDHEYKDRGLAPYTCTLCPFKSADNWALAKHKKVCPAAASGAGPAPAALGPA
jgi:KRAB domain-containing zinc finger protein